MLEKFAVLQTTVYLCTALEWGRPL